jgi:Helix-turn-helix domain
MPVEVDLPRVYTIRELEGILRTGKRQVRNLVSSGRLKSFRIGEKQGAIRIYETSLIEFMTGQEPGQEQTGVDARSR